MAKKVIEYKDIFSPDVEEGLNKLTSKVDDLADSIRTMIAASGNKLKGFSDPKTVADLAAINAQIEAIKKGEASLLEVEKKRLELNKLKQERAKILKDELTLSKASEGSLVQLRVKLKQAQEQYDNLSKAQRDNVSIGGKLLKNIQELDKEVKGLEESTGRHTRSVGNYVSAAKGFEDVLFDGAKALGLNAEQMEELERTYKASLKSIKGLIETNEALATEYKTTAGEVKSMGVAQKIWNFIVGESTGGMKALRIAMAGVFTGGIIFVIYQIADALGAFGSEVEESNDKVKAFDESINNLNDALNDLAVQRLKNTADLISAQLTATGKSIDLTKKLSEAEKEVVKKQLEINKEKINESLKLQEELNQKLGQSNLDLIDDTKSAYQTLSEEQIQSQTQTNSLLTEEKRLELETQLNDQKANYAKLLGESGALKTQLMIQEINFGKDVSDIQKEAADKKKKQLEKETKDLEEELKFRKQLQEDYEYQINKIIQDAEKEQKEKEEEEMQKKRDIRQQQLKDEEDYLKKVQKIKEERDKLNAEYEKEQEEKQRKRIDDAVNTEKQITDVIFQAQQSRLKGEIQQNNDELAESDRKIKLQQERFNQGLENNLDEELKLRNDALAEKKKLEDEAQRQAEIKQLTELYFEFAKLFAKEGDTDAEFKALAKTFAVKGISKVFSGLYEGTESVSESDAVFKLNQTKDNLLVPLHPTERVLGVEDSARLKGMTNDEVVMAAELYRISSLKSDYESDMSKEQIVNKSLTALLLNEISGLKKSYEERPENHYEFNSIGEMVRTEVKKGIKNITIHKHPFE